jgi:hypothetical protein
MTVSSCFSSVATDGVCLYVWDAASASVCRVGTGFHGTLAGELLAVNSELEKQIKSHLEVKGETAVAAAATEASASSVSITAATATAATGAAVVVAGEEGQSPDRAEVEVEVEISIPGFDQEECTDGCFQFESSDTLFFDNGNDGNASHENDSDDDDYSDDENDLKAAVFLEAVYLEAGQSKTDEYGNYFEVEVLGMGDVDTCAIGVGLADREIFDVSKNCK